MKNVLLVHYSEIGTKGKNRGFFERRLRDDIQKRLCPAHASKVLVESSRLIADLTPDFREEAVHVAMGQVFGVAWYSLAQEVSREWPDILAAGLEAAGGAQGAKTFKVYCTRADKAYPLSSQEICNRMGKAVQDKFGLTVNLDRHDLALHVEILPDRTLVYTRKHPGLRGMPRASSGRLLCLFSGGIDSPVAAWLLMRRGAVVHLLHFHPFRKAEELKDSKIFKLHRVLQSYNPTSKLYLVPHYPYQVRALDIPQEQELILFRRFMLRAGEELARRRHMKALITGDSLGQVASQTLDNIAAAQDGLGLPVFLPLVSQDKEEIVRLAQKIGTYDLSIEPYKDCCSLISRHPKTTAHLERIRDTEAKLNLPALTEESLNLMEVWDGQNFLPARPGPLSAEAPASPIKS